MNARKTITVSLESFSALTRYMDAYGVAKAVISLSDLVKIVGIALGFLFIVVGFIAADQAGSDARFVGAVSGIIIGFAFYLCGVVLAALARILIATLDTAVYSSPFLSDEQRARAMSLERTEKIRFRAPDAPEA